MMREIYISFFFLLFTVRQNKTKSLMAMNKVIKYNILY